MWHRCRVRVGCGDAEDAQENPADDRRLAGPAEQPWTGFLSDRESTRRDRFALQRVRTPATPAEGPCIWPCWLRRRALGREVSPKIDYCEDSSDRLSCHPSLAVRPSRRWSGTGPATPEQGR